MENNNIRKKKLVELASFPKKAIYDVDLTIKTFVIANQTNMFKLAAANGCFDIGYKYFPKVPNVYNLIDDYLTRSDTMQVYLVYNYIAFYLKEQKEMIFEHLEGTFWFTDKPLADHPALKAIAEILNDTNNCNNRQKDT